MKCISIFLVTILYVSSAFAAEKKGLVFNQTIVEAGSSLNGFEYTKDKKIIFQGKEYIIEGVKNINSLAVFISPKKHIVFIMTCGDESTAKGCNQKYLINTKLEVIKRIDVCGLWQCFETIGFNPSESRFYVLEHFQDRARIIEVDVNTSLSREFHDFSHVGSGCVRSSVSRNSLHYTGDVFRFKVRFYCDNSTLYEEKVTLNMDTDKLVMRVQ